MQCSSCHHANAPSSRFCGACGAGLSESVEASAACQGCGHIFPSSQKFCGECGRQRDAVIRAQRNSHPAPTREAALSELKIVTVLFSDMCGFTSLSERLDTEELRDLMNGWFGRVSKVIPTFGGTIDKFIGDAVMALFGAPIAHDNDPKRAIDAALAMQAELESYNQVVAKRIGQPLRIRIGINTGRVYAGMLGGEAHKSYTVMGDAVNVASRLESACPVGSILISESTHEHVRGIYNFREQSPLSVKGKSEPLTTVEILGRRTAAARTQMSEDGWATADICRTRELAEVQALFEEVTASKRPRLVAVIGESGMGKNQFSNQLAQTLSTSGLGASLSTHCDAGVGASPFQILIDLLSDACQVSSGSASRSDSQRFEDYLRQTLKGSPDATSECTRVLGHLMGLRAGALNAPANLGDPSAMHHATLAAARQWLVGLASAGPILLRIHNLHNAPDATFDLLSFLVETEELPLFLLFTLGPEASALSATLLKHAAKLQLAPLDIDSSQEVASHLLRNMSTIPADLVNMLAERSGGNPGFIEESVRALLAQGAIVVDDDGKTWRLRDDKLPESLSIPDTVSRMIAVRVDRLSPEGKQVLQWAAVAGPRFDAKLLAALAESDDIEELARIENALREPMEAGLLTATSHTTQRQGEFRFRPALVRDEVYETVVAKTRRQWHQRYADWLRRGAGETDSAQIETIAHHLLCAGGAAQAAQLFRQAGDAAAAIYANSDARDHYLRAKEALERSEATPLALAEIHELLGQVMALGGEHADAQASFTSAIEVLGSTESSTRARLEVRRGRSQAASGNRDLARQSYMQAVLLASEQDSNASILALADAQQNLGWIDYLDGDLDSAEQLVLAALKTSAQVGAELLQARCYDSLGTVARVRGDTGLAITYKERALALRRASDDRATIATSLLNLGVVHFGSGGYQPAVDCFSQSLRLHRQRGNVDGVAMALLNLGGAELHLDRCDAALEHLREATAIALKCDAWYAPECYRYSAEAELMAKNPIKARALAIQGLELLGDTGPIELRGNLCGAIGYIALHEGKTEEATRYLDEAAAAHESARNTFELAVTLTRQSELSSVLGDEQRAKSHLLRARDLFEQASNTTWVERSDLALAQLA